MFTDNFKECITLLICLDLFDIEVKLGKNPHKKCLSEYFHLKNHLKNVSQLLQI